MSHQYYTIVSVESETVADSIVSAASSLKWAGKAEISGIWSVFVVGDSDSLDLIQYASNGLDGWNDEAEDPWWGAPDTQIAGVLITAYQVAHP